MSASEEPRYTNHYLARGAGLACVGLLALGVTRFERAERGALHPEYGENIGRCASCHAAIASRYASTAHFRTSAAANAAAVLGPVPAQVRTSRPTTRFRVERRSDGIHQVATWVAADRVMTRGERIDLVVGSGRRGQSYLYWKNDLLFQLPLSYLVVGGRWVNSPGYVDGDVHFDRTIPPRCMECHATSFRLEGIPPNVKYAAEYDLGLDCRVCHGQPMTGQRPGGPNVHPAVAAVNPSKLTRQQQIDLCALCHSGADRAPRRPPFTFTPGDRLTDHLGPSDERAGVEPDAHGSQVALLARSRCFQHSPAMTCSTCHDVHETARDLTQLSTRCVACHAPGAASLPDTHSAVAAGAETCVDCHMPLRPSRLIRIADGDRTLAPMYRTHRIGIYPPAGNQPARPVRRDRP